MTEPPTDTRTRQRSRRTVTPYVIVAIVVLGAVAALVIAHYATTPAVPGPAAPVPPTTAPLAAGNSAAAQENELAARPMVRLPAQAAQPQALTSQTAGPPIVVPVAAAATGTWVPGGFPKTPEGALGQLKALDETAMAAVDPQVYGDAYRDLAQPGAPDPGSTGLSSLLSSLRSRAGLPATGTVPGLFATFQVTHGQIKGSVADSYVVVCVLGQFSVSINSQVVSAGIGDCQAMRWTGAAWRIASGAQAAPAPCAWPGSADAVKAGYRAVS